MASGMHPSLKSHSTQIRELCARHHVRRLELFGSASRGEDKSTSDFDFLVEFEDLAPGTHADAFFGMLFGLEDLLKRKVDLVTIKSVTNPYFLQEIEPDRQIIYEHALS